MGGISRQTSLIYRDKPVFGLDIGHSSVKLIQIENIQKKSVITAYGTAYFNPDAIKKGVITDLEAIVKPIYDLVTKNLVGSLSTKRVAMSVPNEHSFSRVITLPKMDDKDLADAVRTEAEQSIPLSLDLLYFDYEITGTLADGSIEVQLVAIPKEIIDSYIMLAEALGLEVAFIETNISAVTRIVRHTERTENLNTLIVDLGSTAADLSIFDGKTIRGTGTAECGSENVTKLLTKSLGVTEEQAYIIKTRYGLDKSKKQTEIISALDPELNKLIIEIKKVVRYFAERSKEGEIDQIIILGGGANMPGLNNYITDHTHVPTRLCSPWTSLSFGKLQPPKSTETNVYTTAGGLSLARPEEMSK